MESIALFLEQQISEWSPGEMARLAENGSGHFASAENVLRTTRDEPDAFHYFQRLPGFVSQWHFRSARLIAKIKGAGNAARPWPEFQMMLRGHQIPCPRLLDTG